MKLKKYLIALLSLCFVATGFSVDSSSNQDIKKKKHVSKKKDDNSWIDLDEFDYEMEE